MMDETTLSLTVFFEAPFWVGVFERQEHNTRSVCRIVFGAEPKDPEILALVNQRFHQLHFSPTVADRKTSVCTKNPKRRQREARRALAKRSISTRSQQGLAIEREARKSERIALQRNAREAAQADRYAKRRAKQKAKHRGH